MVFLWLAPPYRLPPCRPAVPAAEVPGAGRAGRAGGLVDVIAGGAWFAAHIYIYYSNIRPWNPKYTI